MGELTVVQVLSVVKDAGLFGALVFSLWGGYKRIWVWGYQLDECREREMAWKRIALQNAGLADKTIDIVASQNQP